MRTIKFRVWDKDEGVMISPDYIDRNGNAHWKSHSIPESSSEVMQFTGLYDKNGKEIWEGDIIRFDEEEYEVKFHPCFYGFVFQNNEHRIMMADAITFTVNEKSNKVEVIGNIHEHPNLLR